MSARVQDVLPAVAEPAAAVAALDAQDRVAEVESGSTDRDDDCDGSSMQARYDEMEHLLTAEKEKEAVASRARRVVVRRLARPPVDAPSQRGPDNPARPSTSPAAALNDVSVVAAAVPELNQLSKRRLLDAEPSAGSGALSQSLCAAGGDTRPPLHLAPPRRPPGTVPRPPPRTRTKTSLVDGAGTRPGIVASAGGGGHSSNGTRATEDVRHGGGLGRLPRSSLESVAGGDDTSMEPASTAPFSLPSLFDTPPRFDTSLFDGGSNPRPCDGSPSALSDDLLRSSRASSSFILPAGVAVLDEPALGVPHAGSASFPTPREREDTRQRVAASVAATRRGLAALTSQLESPGVADARRVQQHPTVVASSGAEVSHDHGSQ